MSKVAGFDPGRDILSVSMNSAELTLLTDAFIHIEGDRVFSPVSTDIWSSMIGRGEDGFYTIPVRSLLVRENDTLTLVDTGFGEDEEEDRDQSLDQCLRHLGIDPGDISAVVNTHLHGDHFLGNTVQTGQGWLPRFPNARYYVPLKDERAVYTGERHGWKTRIQPLAGAGLLTCVDGEFAVSETISCIPTPGHTEGHMSVRVQCGDTSALFLGDLALHRLNLEKPEWGPDWAWSREADVSSRKAVTAHAAETGELLIAGHDPEVPWFTMRREGDAYIAVPV